MKSLLILSLLLLAGCSNPKIVPCTTCGNDAVKRPNTTKIAGEEFNWYVCPEGHVTYKAK